MSSDFGRDFAAAGVSVTAAKALLYPLQRFTLITSVPGYGNATRLDTLRAFVREMGVVTLWRGFPMTAARLLPSNGLAFAVFGALKSEDGARNFAAGAAAGVVSTAAVFPLDFARARQHCPAAPSWHRLVGISLSCGAVYRAAFFGGYELLRDPEWPLWRRWLAAQGVVMAATAASYPLDTMRRRLWFGVSGSGPLSAWRLGLRIVRDEGVRSLYKGVARASLRVALVPTLVVFEEVRRLL